MSEAPRRPPLRYHGGKWRLAPWVLAHFPDHRLYIEPFGGGASVLMRKPRCYAEVYNDLDDEVVNVFRVLRDPLLAEALARSCALTPFSRTEFIAAHKRDTVDPVEQARRAIVRSFFGFGSASLHSANPRGMRARASEWKSGRGNESCASSPRGTGFRADAHKNGTTPAMDWSRWPSQVESFVDRLRGVIIEHRDGLEVIRQHDREDALIYADPPYPMSTRDDARPDYAHEMSDDDHRALARVLREARGYVVLSGYPCELYDEQLYPHWTRLEREHRADGAKVRTEVLWLNPRCARALGMRVPDRAAPAIASAADVFDFEAI